MDGGYELEGDVVAKQLGNSVFHRCYDITTIEQIFFHHNSHPLYFIALCMRRFHLVVGFVCVKGGEIES